ncbi:hypothetical protein [Robertmurraya siralis]|uniref:hypothetical protein n=1 Tax=Robertmurraya siralis TaxID=77777 RepID=UPI0010F5F433|nr:hypothetical protein [Robertmurraya siralis]
MKIYKLPEKIYKLYQQQVKGNENITYDQAVKKLCRNIQLVKEKAPERIERKLLNVTFKYGNLHITTRLGKIIKLVNHKDYKQYSDDWIFPKRRYIELNKELGIEDCKFSKKNSYIRSHKQIK